MPQKTQVLYLPVSLSHTHSDTAWIHVISMEIEEPDGAETAGLKQKEDKSMVVSAVGPQQPPRPTCVFTLTLPAVTLVHV